MAKRPDNKGSDIPILVPSLPSTEELIPFLKRIDSSQWYSNYGPLWREFRSALSARIAVQADAPDLDVAFTSSGTTAIELALRVRAISGRRLCLMPSYTFIASAHAVCNAGLEPFLLDVDEQTLTLTPTIAAAALSHLPEPPAAVLVISAFGAPPDIRAWEEFEAATGIPVVFDAAAALMSLGSAGRQPICASLHATKVLGIGEGGAVLSTDRALIERITAMSGFGFFSNGRVADIRGGNYRISEYTAAVGLAALQGIDRKMDRLRQVTLLYAQRLRNAPIRLQDGIAEQWVSMTLNVRIPAEQLDEVLDRFQAAGVSWRRWWGLGCQSHPAFADLRSMDLPNTYDLAPRIIGVPCHTHLSDESIHFVCDLLTEPFKT